MITSGFKYTFTYLSCQYRNLGEAHFEQQINTGHAQHLEGVTHAHCLVDVESGSDRLVHYNLCDDADGEVWSPSLFAKIQKCLICVILNLAFSHVCN